MAHRIADPLTAAARCALRAPSPLNTQPWRWQVSDGVLDLYADPTRQLQVADPRGRLLVLSCGSALHHARVALAAAGHRAEVTRLPYAGPLLARIRIAGPHDPTPHETALAAAIPRRRTDRRPFSARPVPPATLDRLRAAVAAEGAFLHVVRPDQMPMLAVASGEAAVAELADPAYRDEVGRWTRRPPGAGDGVPAAAAVRPAPRRVRVRDHAPDGRARLDPGRGDDRGAAYAILFGTDDWRDSWLRAGEALSALLLTAVREDLSAAPSSDPVEVAWSRKLLRGLLADAGDPYLVIRLGFAAEPGQPPPVPRRAPDAVIEADHSARHAG